jgi:hypothetical protein
MPVEQAANTDRRGVTHLEAIGRLLAGLAPWIELAADATPEGQARAEYAGLARRAIARAVDPASPDYWNFTRERQPLVDAAFLAQGLLRARAALGDSLEPGGKKHLIAALESTRVIAPPFNNWLLFAASVEAGLARSARRGIACASTTPCGNTTSVQGGWPLWRRPSFHFDYYNSFVIHPRRRLPSAGTMPAWKGLTRVRERAARTRRFRAVDFSRGTFPPVGRSIVPVGAVHCSRRLLRRALPDGWRRAGSRGAYERDQAVDRGPSTFDAEGWLRIGFCGHQPGAGRPTFQPAAYLCSVGLLPLGLPPSDPFWSAPAEP